MRESPNPPAHSAQPARPGFTIDVPVLADADALAALHTRVWREAYTGIVPSFAYDDASLGRRRTMWRRMLDPERERTVHERLRIGRDADGAPVGFLMIGTGRDEDAPHPLELQALNVGREFHGTGLAQALVTELLGDRRAYLWVVEDNPRARRFYEKVGFRADGGTKIDPSLEDLREIRMSR
ncbi:GNAT family N-acetyltransferase [Brachybacterium sp. ACRRE]|uniref:GNAT family N-acetyltransferase n=1 Tax=Brachybacterium sp. ACRRE TaxID=2918184 RepID=UPI001EF3392D|nr:GNAT family N-acetyltransferase [Brachybacterium sp. ACRRE]MCG7308533.1 GNAT family N-acetyltransferase [Brachybacterium sp. ACRRE]